MAIDPDVEKELAPIREELAAMKAELAALKTGTSQSAIRAQIAVWTALGKANDQDAVWDRIAEAVA